MTTKTRTRSPFQAADDFPSVFVTRQSTLPQEEDDKGYADTRHIEFVNAERTIAVVNTYRDYYLIVKTDLTVEQIARQDSHYLGEGYADLRARGVFFVLADLGRNKIDARRAAERFLQGVQDVARPLHVALDGKHAPALTIALKEVEAGREYRRDDERVRAVTPVAKEAGVDPRLLALAIKEDRLEWATPPVAPRQVMVVVKEDATGNLTERLVDEIVLAERTVEGLGRIVFEGGVPGYLLARRERQQQQSVSAILTAREKVEETLESLKQRVERLQKEVTEGQVIGRGFYDTLRLAEDAEKAQQAATAYATEVSNADLPAAFLAGLLKNEYAEDREGRTYRYVQADIRESIKALAAINGMKINQRDYF